MLDIKTVISQYYLLSNLGTGVLGIIFIIMNIIYEWFESQRLILKPLAKIHDNLVRKA